MAADRANPKLRDELLRKLDITKQALSGRVTRRKGQVAMTTADAVHTIAHDEGIDVSRYLSADEMDRVRQLKAQLAAASTGARPTQVARQRSRGAKPAVVSLKAEASSLPGLTASHAKEAKEMAEKVYPRLYVFENSARDVISRVLSAALGEDWWDNAVSKPLRDKAANRQQAEDKEPWHGRRGAHPVHYLDLPDLAKIVKSGKAWPHFEALDLFPRATWFEELVSDMNVSRRIVAHMNPLDRDDVKHIEATFRKWARQLEARKDRLP